MGHEKWLANRYVGGILCHFSLSTPWKPAASYPIHRRIFDATAVAAVYLYADSSQRDTNKPGPPPEDTKGDWRKWDLTCLSRNRWQLAEKEGGGYKVTGHYSSFCIYVWFRRDQRRRITERRGQRWKQREIVCFPLIRRRQKLMGRRQRAKERTSFK